MGYVPIAGPPRDLALAGVRAPMTAGFGYAGAGADDLAASADREDGRLVGDFGTRRSGCDAGGADCGRESAGWTVARPLQWPPIFAGGAAGVCTVGGPDGLELAGCGTVGGGIIGGMPGGRTGNGSDTDGLGSAGFGRALAGAGLDGSPRCGPRVTGCLTGSGLLG